MPGEGAHDIIGCNLADDGTVFNDTDIATAIRHRSHQIPHQRFAPGRCSKRTWRCIAVERHHYVSGPKHAERVHMGNEVGNIFIGRVQENLLRRPALNDAPAFHDGDAIANLHCFIKVMADENDGFSQA